MKGNYYGSHRVINQKGFLPQAAEKLDNSVEIYDNEILIDVIKLQPTSTAFMSISNKCKGRLEDIKSEILHIVEEKGKFQDPITKSGGMLIGTVSKIGNDIKDSELKVGDKIATLVSLSLTPLKIERILNIDVKNHQIYIKGYAVLFESGIYTKIPDDISENVSLAAMDVAGAPARVDLYAKPGDIVTVLGAGKAGLLCLAKAKERVGSSGKVICIENSKEKCRDLLELEIADIVINTNAQNAIETLEKFKEFVGDNLSDFTINTVNVENTELSTILITKDSGSIYFFSMSTNFVKASLGAEGVKKYPKMLIGNGYCLGHAETTYKILRNNPKLLEYFTKNFT